MARTGQDGADWVVLGPVSAVTFIPSRTAPFGLGIEIAFSVAA